LLSVEQFINPYIQSDNRLGKKRIFAQFLQSDPSE